MAQTIEELLSGNQLWSDQVKEKDPTFFEQTAKGQSPQFLWIGCADSRVPATQLTGAEPGNLFVHRNIANMVVHTDSNFLSVANYAVKALKVKHIIVCGHYGCGGVAAAMSNKTYGMLDNWLLHIKDVYRFHEIELADIQDEKERFDRFVELNVMEQVKNISKISFIQEEWENGETPLIHSWVYDLKKGKINVLADPVSSNTEVAHVYRYH
jgi:carbonic anhydrase